MMRRGGRKRHKKKNHNPPNKCAHMDDTDFGPMVSGDIRPASGDKDAGRWKVTLYFQGRSATVDYIHIEGKPTLRQVVERLSYETYSAMEALKTARPEDHENERKRDIVEKIKRDVDQMRHLFGEGYFKLFINDDKFAKIMVAS